MYVDNIANDAAAGAHFGLDAFIRNSYRSYRLRQVMVEAATLQNARIAADLRRIRARAWPKFPPEIPPRLTACCRERPPPVRKHRRRPNHNLT